MTIQFSTQPRLELRGITKRYPSVCANDNVSLSVMPGEIHAVLGENGAGKSTLMKIIYGAVHADQGEMLWDGHPVKVANPAAARQLGIGMVFQHFSLFETLTVAENIALALDTRFDLAALSVRIREVSERYGLAVEPERLVHTLSVGERQRVEIVRCLLQNPRLLIMDEPTSVLTPQAVIRLFVTLRQLAAEGCAILYISHKLDEIQQLCDRATVLRGGKVSGMANPREETAESLAQLMIGRALPRPERRAHSTGDTRLQLQQLDLPTRDPFGVSLSGINLQVHAGEILGIAGVSGNGQAELLSVLSGEQRIKDAAAVRLCDEAVGRMGPSRRRDRGLAFVPEERLGRGAVPAMSLTDNALLTAHRQGLVRKGLIASRKVREFAEACIRDFGVKCGGPDAPARSLSGGNLQKFIVGREMRQQPRVLIVAQPTWGVDVGAAAFIRQQLLDFAAQGVAVLVISEELEELFQICDRISVIAGGRLSVSKAVAETNSEEIGLWMAGMFEGGPAEQVAA